tara:strand:- start:83 stop:565 length:483 start_codon:yes stop_codon:yes gene_type:complete
MPDVDTHLPDDNISFQLSAFYLLVFKLALEDVGLEAAVRMTVSMPPARLWCMLDSAEVRLTARYILPLAGAYFDEIQPNVRTRDVASVAQHAAACNGCELVSSHTSCAAINAIKTLAAECPACIDVLCCRHVRVFADSCSGAAQLTKAELAMLTLVITFH